jgi:hypothetical protein
LFLQRRFGSCWALANAATLFFASIVLSVFLVLLVLDRPASLCANAGAILWQQPQPQPQQERRRRRPFQLATLRAGSRRIYLDAP